MAWTLLLLGGMLAAAAVAPSSAAAARDLIAYDNSSGIHVIEPDGTGQRLIVARRGNRFPRRPRWSPNGRRLAYHVERVNLSNTAIRYFRRTAIFIARANGRGRRRLVKAHSLTWLTGGREIVYHANRRDEDYGPLRIVNVRTREVRKLPVKGGSATSPDGGTIAYFGPEGLTVAGRDGAEPRTLTGPGRYYADLPVRWVSARAIAYGCYLERRGDATSDICVVDVETGDVDTIRPMRRIAGAGLMELEMATSPSGGRYVVAAQNALYTVNRRGRRVRVLATNPSWSGSGSFHGVDWR